MGKPAAPLNFNLGDDDTGASILHVDMDSFFAAVEVLDFPHLANFPLAIGGRDGTGVVACASYSARKFGVRAAMPLTRAQRLCPQLVVRPARLERYKEISGQVMQVLRSFSPILEQISIDEAFLQVDGVEHLWGSPLQIASAVRLQLRQQLNLPASVGVGKNKLLAKIASNQAKPNGVFLVPVAQSADFLAQLQLGAIWGIGASSEAKLARCGIKTVLEVRQEPLSHLVRILGKAAGEQLYQLVRGEDSRRVEVNRERKSIGQENTFSPYLFTRDEVLQAIRKQSHSCARQLRRLNMLASTISLKVRNGSFETVTRSRTLPAATQVGEQITACASELWNKMPFPASGVRLVGVSAENLQDAARGLQLELDGDCRWLEAEKTLDILQAKFGEGQISLGMKTKKI